MAPDEVKPKEAKEFAIIAVAAGKGIEDLFKEYSLNNINGYMINCLPSFYKTKIFRIINKLCGKKLLKSITKKLSRV